MRLQHSILAVSAVAIGALAEAGTASMGIGGFTAVTASTGTGPDNSPVEVLYVIDNRGESLLVYGVETQLDRRMVLLGGASLPVLFRAGRGG